MPRHRMVAPINSIKHYVQHENTSITAGTRRSIVIADAVSQSAAGAAPEDILEGSILKAVYVELWVKSNATSGNDAKFQLTLEKLPVETTFITFTQMNNLMSYPNKKNVLFVSQGVIGDLTTASIPIVRQWFKIPKGKQRFGVGDTLHLAISATTFAMDSCGFSVYKEYK